MVRRTAVLIASLLAATLAGAQPFDDQQDSQHKQSLTELLQYQKELRNRQAEAESVIAQTANPDLSKFSAADLLMQGQILMEHRDLLSARTRLLAAVEKDPNYYPAHMSLSAYYLGEVGHFKLALKYIKQAIKLFEQQHGLPPYDKLLSRLEHGNLLRILSQIRLNLDDYQGALDALDQYESFGYFAEWYPSNRAWVLMKLKRIPEAIKQARIGVMASTSPGGSLNMLGILLSVAEQPEEALSIFEKAIRYEKILGNDGQPATPLNNAGEVYRERFRDLLAQTYWNRAKKSKDGCEHVLPSLNLAILMLDQLRPLQAEAAIKSFETCRAQYPMRSDEEHRSLVSLARGRIQQQQGNLTKARRQLEDSLDRSQWFGKIGTNENDLKIAALISYAAALEAECHNLEWRIPLSVGERIRNTYTRMHNRLLSWWTLRKARFLFQSMDNMEDIDVRHTDSLLDYPNLGFLLKDLPTKSLFERLDQIAVADDRPLADNYYNAYRAENLLHHGHITTGIDLANSTINSLKSADRTDLDAALLLRLHLIRMQALGIETVQYQQAAIEAFTLERSALRNHGLPLPVNANPEGWKIRSSLRKVGFYVNNAQELPFKLQVQHTAAGFELRFEGSSHSSTPITVKGNDLAGTLNKLSKHVFTHE